MSGSAVLHWLQQHASIAATAGRAGRRYTPRENVGDECVTPNTCRALAVDIGGRIEELAWEKDGQTNWWTVAPKPHDTWEISPLGPHLYNGVPGIAVFLASLRLVGTDARLGKLADRLAGQVCSFAAAHGREVAGLGGFFGTGGLIYCLACLAKLYDSAEFTRVALNLCRHVRTRVGDETRASIMCGLAGAACNLTALATSAGSDEALAAAAACGDRLLAIRTEYRDGVGWPLTRSRPPVLGFAYGTSGVAYALAQLAVQTRKRVYSDVARDVIRLETAWFDKQEDNWPDLKNPKRPRFVRSWCEGAAGISMARIAMNPWINDLDTLTNVTAAVDRLARDGFGFNHGLCCGDLGNLEALKMAGNGPAFRMRLGQIVGSIASSGPICGVPTPVPSEVPQLMQGLAGIGLGLMRCANPRQVPNIALLQCPSGQVDEGQST